MIPLYHCKCCGFLSTLRSEFTVIDGILVDKDCAEKIGDGVQPSLRWFEDAKAAKAAEKAEKKPYLLPHERR